MDNAWLGDIDGDGDLDAVTTEENGGWGVIWFENPLKDGAHQVNLPLSKIAPLNSDRRHRLQRVRGP